MTTNRPHRLDIVIVNWNNAALLRQCLGSIRENVRDIGHQVIIVDNGSTDGSPAMVSREFPEVVVVRNPVNAGFASANNTGVRQGRGDLILLLNNDTRLLTSPAPAMLAFDREEALGVIGCKMVYGDGSFQPSFGYEHTPVNMTASWLGFGKFPSAPKVFRRDEIRPAEYARERMDVAWVSGAFLMTRRSLWERLGGLDERYFMYIEDVDYCRRARNAGSLVGYTPEVAIVHYEGAGKAWAGRDALARSMRSYRIFWSTYYAFPAAMTARILLGIVMLARAAAYAIRDLVRRSGLLREKKRAYFQAALVVMGFSAGDHDTVRPSVR